MKTEVAIVGATGYTGVELARLLSRHPHVQIAVVTSERWAGESFAKHFPAYQGRLDLVFEPLQPSVVADKAKWIFLCLPHHESMSVATAFLQQGCRIIDLSADFRLKHLSDYQQWYGPHEAPELLDQAVYGLPELYRAQIRGAALVANPGCYPTSCILGLAPLMEQEWIDLSSIRCDAKSGASGAGRAANVAQLFCEVHEGIKAYGVGKHRHTPEIEQELSLLAKKSVVVTFTPHLMPMNRGILSTLYAKATCRIDAGFLHRLYLDFYRDEPFVRVRPIGSFPSTQDVRLTNYCDLGVHFDERTLSVIVVSAIDNLTKGASGQAVQNMNLMMGLEENTGLNEAAPFP